MQRPRPGILLLLAAAVVLAVVMQVRNSDSTADIPSVNQMSAAVDNNGGRTASTRGAVSTKSQTARHPAKIKVTATNGSQPGSAPAEVLRAINDQKIVVIVFYANSLVGKQVRQEYIRLRTKVRSNKISFFSEDAKRIARYSLFSEHITQVPAVVIIDRKRQLHIVEGYVDHGALAVIVARAEGRKVR